MKAKINQEILEHAITLLTENKTNYVGVYGCDLHNELFNTDYYVIGYFEADQFINRCGGAWKSIHTIQNYEMEMFGECHTDLTNSEKVANMLAYIEGELVLMECESLRDCWDEKMTIENIESIIEDLRNLV